jgi:hypothetical protein
MLTVRDWPSLISSGNKPEPVTHSTTPNNYPYQSALYQVTNNEETSRSLTILIPEDHCIYIGFAYSATGTAAVRAVKVLEDGSDGDAVVLSPLSVTDTTLTTNVFSNSLALGEKVVALRIYISRTDNSTSTITMRGGFAKILPNEKMLPSFAVEEQWVSGEGFSGCVMASAPQMTYKGMVDGRRLVTMSTTLKEIGAWL